ncbi:MAG: GerAB/ArcD/ProY family transporter [Thermincola sp.]|nr:GerAB/ArcD/ProY family transporter [Thermincola sp.]
MFKVKEGNIGPRGLFIILTLMLISKLFLGVPRAIAIEGDSAACLLLLVAAGVAVPGIFVLVKLLQRFPGRNLVEIAEAVWGRAGAVAVSLLVALFFLALATIIVREFAETLLTTVLPSTPISVISFMFILAMLVGAYHGLEVITRTSTLLFPFILAGIFSILMLTVNFLDLNSVFPIFGSGPKAIAIHALGRNSLYMELLFVGLIAANLDDPTHVSKTIWKTFLAATFMFLVVELVYISALRVSSAQVLYVPLFQLAKMIYLGRFIQRIESLYIFIWMFVGGLKLTLLIYGAAISLSWGLKIPIFQPLLFPLTLLAFALSFVPPSVAVAVNLDINIFSNYGGLISWGLPFVLLITAWIRKKGGGKNQKPKVN